jgi:LysR family transcriptional regulator, benzoate and cis,cis-muconate-responsive activator of ben and cat genes
MIDSGGRLAFGIVLSYPIKMELRHIRYFLAVAKHLSFVKAADTLHISQPPLSRQIQEFEEEIGTPLFDRKSHKTTLTKAGEYLMVEAERSLERLEAICRTAKNIGDVSPTSLKIGCVSFLLYSILPPFLEVFRATFPEIKLEILVMSTEEQETALRSKAIDVGFARSWIHEEGIVYDPLMEEKLALVFPADFSKATDPEKCMADIASLPFITLSHSVAPGLTDRLLSICAGYGSQPSVGFESNDAYSIIKLVASRLGWTIVPNLEFQEASIAGVASIPLTETIILGLCYHDRDLLEHEKKFIALAESYFFERFAKASSPKLALP